MAAFKHISSKNADYGAAEKYLTFAHDENTMKPTLDVNGSGKIHVHIVINSLRIEEVPMLPYMDRPADTRAGCKHRCTDAAMEYFKSEVMEMCRRENLYQIDLLNGGANCITEREYWAMKKGQAKLDAEAAEQNKPPTKFETDKEKLRQIIREALATATGFDEFSNLLLCKGVSVSESRGRLSYLTPDRTKPITARRLGDDMSQVKVFKQSDGCGRFAPWSTRM